MMLVVTLDHLCPSNREGSPIRLHPVAALVTGKAQATCSKVAPEAPTSRVSVVAEVQAGAPLLGYAMAPNHLGVHILLVHIALMTHEPPRGTDRSAAR